MRRHPLTRGVRETISEEVTFELRPERREGPSHAKKWGESIPRQENSMSQGPVVGRSRVCSRKRKKTYVCTCGV